MVSRRTMLLAVLLAFLSATGCGEKLQKAGGKVLVDGQPVTDGTILFHPVAPGRPASAVIGSDGTFVISYRENGDGLPPGEYRVVIVADIWKESKGKTKAQLAEEAAMKKSGAIEDTSLLTNGVLIHIVPPEYNDVATTPLKQVVTSSSEPQQFVYEISTSK